MKRIFISIGILLMSLSAQAAQLDLTSYKGQVVYVDFWASWCGPCRASFPWMQLMHQKYQQKGLTIIAVNVDQEADLAAEFLSKYHPEFNIAYDPDGQLAQEYGVSAMPTSFLIDRNGNIKVTHKGFHKNKVDDYEREIQQLLSE
ncbi:TlpA disulfide reductase family protein [Gynuella sunshinyii]|uniref:Thiol-disulfide isomerase and thioredoxins n=1 Tax=Gynuella sunshinyii YC6258 TaxID=1445510 RepID=A0A0C5VK31_9GAMM|nr:TlpA disulfide reductase family protein [Gynuella sunshinyii]AJQ93723.1 thiol-disulfide isomerase and thioredoxins [Gynuella sunshinyii YC6258]